MENINNDCTDGKAKEELHVQKKSRDNEPSMARSAMARSGRIAIRPTAQLCQLPGKAASCQARQTHCQGRQVREASMRRFDGLQEQEDERRLGHWIGWQIVMHCRLRRVHNNCQKQKNKNAMKEKGGRWDVL